MLHTPKFNVGDWVTARVPVINDDKSMRIRIPLTGRICQVRMSCPDVWAHNNGAETYRYNLVVYQRLAQTRAVSGKIIVFDDIAEKDIDTATEHTSLQDVALSES